MARIPKLRNDSAALRYHLARAMARAGAADRAAELYTSQRVWSVRDVDYQSLGARILKDKAFDLPFGEERRELLLQSARAYEKVYENYPAKRSYTAVNAATMYLLAGDERAEKMAAAALEQCADEAPGDDEGRYWHAATIAEAQLVLGDTETARSNLREGGRASL